MNEPTSTDHLLPEVASNCTTPPPQGMLGLVHHQITSELEQTSKTDSITIVTAVFFNLLILAINSAIAENGGVVYISIFLALTAVVNYVSLSALSANSNMRLKLLGGLLDLYKDTGVDKYYDASMLNNYGERHWYFQAIVASLAVVAVVVPILISIGERPRSY